MQAIKEPVTMRQAMKDICAEKLQKSRWPLTAKEFFKVLPSFYPGFGLRAIQVTILCFFMYNTREWLNEFMSPIDDGEFAMPMKNTSHNKNNIPTPGCPTQENG